MTADQIRCFVDLGYTVHWVHPGYRVIRDRIGQYLVWYRPNNSYIGLTWTDGHTLNGRPDDFHIDWRSR